MQAAITIAAVQVDPPKVTGFPDMPTGVSLPASSACWYFCARIFVAVFYRFATLGENAMTVLTDINTNRNGETTLA